MSTLPFSFTFYVYFYFVVHLITILLFISILLRFAQVVRAQLQDELLSLRSYVLRSEETVQELQEQARRQAREVNRVRGSGGYDSGGARGGGGGAGANGYREGIP